MKGIPNLSSEQSLSTAVSRALAILEGLADRSGGMTNSEISRKIRIPRSSASYLLRTLERSGYLRRDRETGKYSLGLKVLNLSRGVLVGLDIRQLALPLLRELAQRVHLTVHLAILDQNQAVYIEKVEVPGFIKMDTWVGRRMEVYSTSVGKALVMHLPEPEVEAIVKGRGLHRRTPKTITLYSGFQQELAKVRGQGYAVDDEENSLGARCVAVPVFNSFGNVEASIGVTGTTNQVKKSDIPAIALHVMEASRKLSHQLGYSRVTRRVES